MKQIPTSFSPMLAATVRPDKEQDLRFPLIGTPKLDGIRCLTLPLPSNDARQLHSLPVTRALKEIPNNHVWRTIAAVMHPGFDGELMVPEYPFNEACGSIMREDLCPPFVYHVFDFISSFSGEDWIKEVRVSYAERLELLREAVEFVSTYEVPWLKVVPSYVVESHEDLAELEEKCLTDGYEGVCLRAPDSPYKFGRSTFNEHYLMKLKRFTDGEAKIIGYEPLLHNANEKMADSIHNRRHNFKAGMKPKELIGKFIVVDLKTGVEFSVGSGLTLQERTDYWRDRYKLVGKIIKYKHQLHGAKDKPRLPIYLGFRDKRDL